MVFFRRRGLPEKRKPTWKKYTVAYTGTAEKTAITTSVNSDETAAKRTEVDVTYYPVASEPRMTGDGYYESCIIGIEGNQIELTE